MANRHPSAVKRNRQNIKRQERNYAIRSRLRNEVRKVREAVESRDSDAADGALRTAIKEISKAATKGILHKNSASRRISRLSRSVAAIRSQQA